MRAPLAFALLIGCAAPPPPPSPAADPLAGRVAWAAAEAAPEVPVATLPAEVAPAPGGLLELGPGVEGRLLQWAVGPGDRVAEGQPLARLASADLSDRLAQVGVLRDRARAAAEQARLIAASADAGVATAAEAQAAAATAAEAQAALRGAEAGLGARADTRAAAGGWAWTAPAAGAVARLSCAPGPVAADAVCLALLTDAAAEVHVGLPERLLAWSDGPLRGAWTGADGTAATLTLRGRAPLLDPRSRQRRLRFEAPAGARVGASGRLGLLAAADGVVGVPAAALTRLGGEDVVFVGEATPVPRSVEPVGQDADRVYLRGVQPGEQVAVKGVFLLKSLAALAAEGDHAD
jgi:multidrug efflux pump subunit AcrA (membrane-fusion protein)